MSGMLIIFNTINLRGKKAFSNPSSGPKKHVRIKTSPVKAPSRKAFMV